MFLNHLLKMASRAMNRNVAASYRKLVAIQNLSHEHLNGINIFDGRSSISTLQGRTINTLSKQTNLLNNVSDYNGIRNSNLFSKSFAKDFSSKSEDVGQAPAKKRYTPKVKLDFCYDTISPYSWFAFEILQRYKPVWNLDINYKPVFMAGLTKQNKNKFLESLTGVPNKSLYLFQDVERVAAYYQVPLRVPESPFYLLGVAGSLKQQRFLTAIKIHFPEYIEACSRELWYRCWSEDMDATQDQSLLVIGSRAGMKEENINSCIQAMQGDEVKNMLKDTTSSAVEDGAFGLPFIIIRQGKDHLGIEDETFFGSDRFEVIAHKLGVEWRGPIPDPESFVPAKMAPDYTQKELFEELEHIGAIKTDFTIPEDTPTSQPKRAK